MKKIETCSEVWNEHAAARYLGMAVGTLRHWRHVGKGPRYLKYRASQAIRYLKEDLDKFMKESIVIPHREEDNSSAQKK
jgi:hypothetical protein